MTEGPRERGNKPVADGDPRRMAPSAGRNRDVIQSVLVDILPERGLVLEIASGSGEHVVHFASRAGRDLVFQPSDVDAEARASIDAWVADSGLPNVRPAIEIDVREGAWPITRADAMLAINMIHIAPWEATLGLVAGADRLLSGDGFLFLYGPFRRNGAHTAASNAAFDADLRSRNPAWGVRDLEAVAGLARQHGFAEPEVVAMPANNLSVVFRRT